MKRFSLLTILVIAMPWLGTCDVSKAAAKAAPAQGAVSKKAPAAEAIPQSPHGATIVRVRKDLVPGVPPPPLADQARVAAARPVVQLLGLRQKAIEALERFVPTVTKTVRFRNPKLTDAEMKTVPDRIRANAYATLGRLLEYAAHIYARHYTVEQLKAMAAFYRTDTGKRMLSEEPKINLEMGPVKGGWTFGFIVATTRQMGGTPPKAGEVVRIVPNAKPEGPAANPHRD